MRNILIGIVIGFVLAAAGYIGWSWMKARNSFDPKSLPLYSTTFVKETNPHQDLEKALKCAKTEHKKVSINPGRKAVVSFYLDPKISRARLFVTTSPLDCRIRILNINPVFHNNGIDCKVVL